MLVRMEICVCERANLENFLIFTFQNRYFLQYFLVQQTFPPYNTTCLSVYMYWQKKSHGGGQPPPPPLAKLITNMTNGWQWLDTA